MIYKALVNRFGKDTNIDQFKALMINEKVQTTPIHSREQSCSSSHDLKLEEQRRRDFHDFWVGKMLA